MNYRTDLCVFASPRLIVVENKRVAEILKKILIGCGCQVGNYLHQDENSDYLVMSWDRAKEIEASCLPAVLVPEQKISPPNVGNFIRYVVDYDRLETDKFALADQFLTYSVSSDNADFTARNICLKEGGGVVFEIVGVGVIGRVRLKQEGLEEVKACLIAAAGALAGGLPFARVLNSLNCL